MPSNKAMVKLLDTSRLPATASATDMAMGTIIKVVAVLDIHIDKSAAVAIKPAIKAEG